MQKTDTTSKADTTSKTDPIVIEIVTLLEDMRPLFERACISDKFTIFAESNKLPGYCLEEAKTWLLANYDGPYKDYMKIRKMQPETFWKRYELWGEFDEHRECKLLAERLTIFKQSCRDRPLIFKHNACLMAITENERAKPKNKVKKTKKESHED